MTTPSVLSVLEVRCSNPGPIFYFPGLWWVIFIFRFIYFMLCYMMVLPA